MVFDLREVGLTENESKVYLGLIDLGPSLAGQISRKTGLHRRTVYDVTEMLIKKGLIGYILQNNRKLFQAVNPNRLLEIVQEKQNILEPFVQELSGRYVKTREKEETNFYKGKEGLKSVFEDQLEAREILILNASPRAYDLLKFYFHWYDKKRKVRRIKARILATDRNVKDISLAEIRYLPQKYSNPVAVNIYGDKVAIILWASEPLAIVIKNREIAEGYRNYFELMWRVGKV
jgi:HTH-type transcriptional regulator, sugar sensing transcriptional regulator